MTILELYNEFIISKKMQDLSQSTLDSYDFQLRGFIRTFKNIEKDNLTYSLVSDYIIKLNKRKISHESKRTYIRMIRVFLKWCDENYSLPFNVSRIKGLKSTKKIIKNLSVEEFNKLLRMVSGSHLWIKLRNQLLLCIMYDSGSRLKEVTTIKKSDIYDEGYILVHGKGNKDRYVPIGNYTIKLIKKYIDECPFKTSEYLFYNNQGNRISTGAIKTVLNRLKHKSGINVYCHLLRHEFATNTIIDSINTSGSVDAYQLQSLMGHSEMSTTQKYIHETLTAGYAKKHCSHLDRISDSIELL